LIKIGLKKPLTKKKRCDKIQLSNKQTISPSDRQINKKRNIPEDNKGTKQTTDVAKEHKRHR
jgi:hypothetical protein